MVGARYRDIKQNGSRSGYTATERGQVMQIIEVQMLVPCTSSRWGGCTKPSVRVKCFKNHVRGSRVKANPNLMDSTPLWLINSASALPINSTTLINSLRRRYAQYLNKQNTL
jgi:hypothetical protein